MTIKINVGVNKKIGLPDYGSAGSHCAIEIEADNSVLQDAEQFLQRVQDAYEVARQSVEAELAHHRPNNGASQSDKEPEQKQRQEYRNDNSGGNNSGGSHYIASAKQQQFIASLVKGVKGLDWRTLDRYCSNKFGGKTCSQLSPKEASRLSVSAHRILACRAVTHRRLITLLRHCRGGGHVGTGCTVLCGQTRLGHSWHCVADYFLVYLKGKGRMVQSA